MNQIEPIKPALLYNLEAEQQLLGSLMLFNEGFDRLPSGFGAFMFADPVHGLIYEMIEEGIGAGMPVTPITLKTQLGDHPGLAELGGIAYLARLCGATISASELPGFARIIRNAWARRDAAGALRDAVGRLESERGADDAVEALAAAQGTIGLCAATLSPKPLTHSMQAALDEAALRTETAYKNDGRPLMPTGIRGLDEKIGGLLPADHIVLIGESSMGKTAAAINIGLNVALGGRGVLFGSLEMPKQQIAHRIASCRLADAGNRIEYNRLVTGKISEQEFRTYIEASSAAGSLPIMFAEGDATSLPKLLAAAQATKRAFERSGTPLGLIVVDYLQLIQVPNAQSDTQRVGAAANAMKTLAKEFDVPVISLSQMSRENKKRDNKRPQPSDARQSAEIEQSADVMVGCYREAYYLARDLEGMPSSPERSEMIADLENLKNDLELIILKNRRGPLGTVHAWVDLPVNRLLDEDPTREKPIPAQDRMDFH